MISNHWLGKRRKFWERLEKLLDQTGQKGFNVLTRSELRELAFLYRQTASDLSVLREDESGGQLARYLNGLLGRAHNIIYSGQKSSYRGIVTFYLHDYPLIFRATFPYTCAAVLLFALGAVVGTILTLVRPEFMHRMLGSAMVATIERRQMWTDSIVGIQPIASSGIMTNNLSVSFLTFALGITGGVGTAYMELFNGLLIGVIGAACWLAGMSVKLWSFVVPHGALELPAIFIAGGAGFRIAQGLLFPGFYSRPDALVKAGMQAVRLMLGTLPMLIIAGIIEGFFSPSGAAVPLKFLIGGCLFTLLVLYLTSNTSKESETSTGLRD